MRDSPADEVFDALVAAFPVRDRTAGLVGIRRAEDEAVLLFWWPPEQHLFGVPVSLTRIDRRLDWDRPADTLEEWIDSVDLWIMEEVDNGFRYRAHRRAVDDYVELRKPNWPMDDRFCFQVNEQIEHDWTLLEDLPALGLAADVALAAQRAGTLLAWTFSYENNSTGRPVVGHSTVIWDGPEVACLVDLKVGDNVPPTVAVDLVRAATHAAAEAGARVVDASGFDFGAWPANLSAIAGFRAGPEGLRVQTDFLTEDPELAAKVHQTARASPGRWGDNRDRVGRYLPSSRVGRWLHRLRYGHSGKPPRIYVA